MIKSVSYQKSFWIGSYLQHKLEMHIDLDPGQSPEEALTEAKKRIDAWDKDNNTYSPPESHVEGVIQVEKDSELDKELAIEIAILETYKYKEEAEAYLSKSTFKYRPELKVIVNNKESKPIK